MFGSTEYILSFLSGIYLFLQKYIPFLRAIYANSFEVCTVVLKSGLYYSFFIQLKQLGVYILVPNNIVPSSFTSDLKYTILHTKPERYILQSRLGRYILIFLLTVCFNLEWRSIHRKDPKKYVFSNKWTIILDSYMYIDFACMFFGRLVHQPIYMICHGWTRLTTPTAPVGVMLKHWPSAHHTDCQARSSPSVCSLTL